MKLKVQIIKIAAGKPVIFLHEYSAKKIGVHTGDRVTIKKNGNTVVAIVDLASGFIKQGEAALSEELVKVLAADAQGYIDVVQTETAESSAILHDNLKYNNYSAKDLQKIMQDIVNNRLTEAEIAYFITGVNHYGMSHKEIIYLTEAIVKTGVRIKWKHKIIADKHSIGGIAVNRTTPIVVSICAAAGVIMPKTSSRAISSAAGTADTIESIAQVSLSISELKKVVNKTGACLVWGGSLGLAPADDKLIRVEKMLRIDPEAQLLASILAKKIAVGSTHVVIDIPFGNGAKVSRQHAEKLGQLFTSIGKKLGLTIKVVLTDGKEPIGNGIGPVLEMRDVFRVLKQDNSPKDLEHKALFLAGAVLEMVGKSKKGQGMLKAKEILYSGLAYEKFAEIITAQGGDPKQWLPEAKYHHNILSNYSGIIKHIDNKSINYIARLAGCPVDKASGIYLYKHIGSNIKKEEKIITIYSESKEKLREAIRFFKKQKPIVIN